MTWSTVDFKKLILLLLPTFLRKSRTIAFLNSTLKPLENLHKNILYKMQHDGRTIYLEKLLNEYFSVPNYDTNNHDGTKKVFIDDIPALPKLYIHQDEEDDVLFLNENGIFDDQDVFLDSENENNISYSWIIFIPQDYFFDEIKVRAFVDEFRYIGRKYIIQTY